ncbi:MAG: S53 family peptidase [Burkholderiales bacterium]|nr:S53 family peptidase [Burkholderiales bacterium]
MEKTRLIDHPFAAVLSATAVALGLAACGGGTDEPGPQAAAAPLATAITTLDLSGDALPEDVSALRAMPTFHVAPVLLAPPEDIDATDPDASARMQPRMQMVPAETRGLASQRLTPQALKRAQPISTDTAPVTVDREGKMAAGAAVTTYSPAQIRAAYGFPALPASTATLTTAQAAQLGAGQTIYVVGAYHNPNAAAELAAFNQKFGLPTCTTKAIAATSALPLAAANAKACELSVVYATANGTMTAAAPAYDAGWATELALDVQWTHATAPLARIVLVEAADASLNSLLGAIRLANAMGPGIVSMSFGANEGNWTASVDSAFTGTNMTYLAATGDSGAAVSWPAVSPKVIAVSGTTLTYSGTGTRSEVVWTGTGGGVSAYTAVPSYQTSAVPGMGTLTKRAVADVAFNADPSTGQYVAVLSPGATTPNWISAGGTSLSTPQWAGLMAVANAMRTANANAVLATPHATLYSQIATVPGTYAATFKDITQGANGACGTCVGKTAYDTPTGLGTPNAGNLLSTLSGVAAPAVPPVVTPASISGTAGTALSFTVSATAPNAMTYALTGAPTGMTIGTTGAVTWPSPVAGTYAVTVTAKDTKTGLTGQGIYTVTIVAPQAPAGTSSTINGKPGVALSFTAAFTAPNAMTYTMSGAPSGMSISTTGVVSWAKPVLGTYKVTVTAKDTKTALTGQAVYTVNIANTTPAAGPVISAPPIAGVAGKPVTGTIAITDIGATSLQISVTGIPMGMMFSINGSTVTASWPNPIAGNYTLTVTVTDNLGRTAKSTVPVTIAVK